MLRLVCLLFSLLISPLAQADLQVEQPDRAYGYFIGDLLVQRVNLDNPSGRLRVPDLAIEQRIDAYLYRFSAAEILLAEQSWLELRYQLINSPVNAETISLPAITFKTETGAELQLAPWRFTIAPLTSRKDTSGMSTSSMLPDRAAMQVIEITSDATFKLTLVGLLVVVALWLSLGLYSRLRDSQRLPFAKANRAIKRLPAAQRDSSAQAWIALHHAFNQAAGKTITGATLTELFAAATWLKRFENQIETFYSASAARFFEQSEIPISVAVSDLCATLKRAEQVHSKVGADGVAS